MRAKKNPNPYRCDKCGRCRNRETGKAIGPRATYTFRRCDECEAIHGPDPRKSSPCPPTNHAA